MLCKKQLIQSFYLILTMCGLAQAGQWNGIIPLESTRADVEKIIGNPEPDSKNEDAAFYKTKNERVFVLYSAGTCDVEYNSGWNISKGKVISLTVYPVIKTKFDDYKFDKSKFYYYVEHHISFLTTYTNLEDGVGFLVNTDIGEIGAFSYFPKSKDAYLLCK